LFSLLQFAAQAARLSPDLREMRASALEAPPKDGRPEFAFTDIGIVQQIDPFVQGRGT
jgi:hypothetical protein